MSEVAGSVDPRFEPVREVFRANFERGELGAGCAVVVEGRTVVDLWGGWADIARTKPWMPDTLVNVYSVGKPFVALAVLQLVGTGDLDLDEPASRVWPELLAGQQGATVRHVLCHRAGVPAIRQPLTNDDLWNWDAMAAAVATTEPWWVPGSRHVYHTNTYGFLTGEVARRVTGCTPGEWLRDAVAGPLEADVQWGVPAGDLSRCAEVDWQSPTAPPIDWSALPAMTEDQRILTLGYSNPPGFSSMGVVNTTPWRQAQVPSTNLHATALGVARVYAALVAGGGPIVDAPVLREAVRPQSEGWCPVLAREATFGLGFQPTRPDRPFGPNPHSYGHFGTGGSLGFADPDAGLAFGYVMNAVKPRWQNDRNRALVAAVYDCL